ncbi:MAG: retropepsin-like aspartic protease [Acidobacteriota bacterium]
MAETLTFAVLHKYDTRETGITVPVVMKVGNKSVRFSAKLDTGASVCIFDRARGEALGLDIESGLAQKISTATGSFLAYGHEVTLFVAGIETYTTAYFADDDNFTKNVLGRQGWLERVRLGLVDYEGKLYLNRYDEE